MCRDAKLFTTRFRKTAKTTDSGFFVARFRLSEYRETPIWSCNSDSDLVKRSGRWFIVREKTFETLHNYGYVIITNNTLFYNTVYRIIIVDDVYTDEKLMCCNGLFFRLPNKRYTFLSTTDTISHAVP